MEVEVYETVDEESNDEDINVPENTNENILTDEAIASDAFEKFITRNENLNKKIARIRQEIEDIKTEAPPNLLEELRKLIDAPQVPIESPKVSDLVITRRDKHLESSEEFGKIESRIARIESHLGTSVRSSALDQPIAVLVKQMQATLDLISMDPQLIQKRINSLKRIQIDDSIAQKINWIYSRLHKIDSQLHLAPGLISRLQTLRFVHSETLNAKDQLNSIFTEINAIKNEIKEWKICLNNLEKTVEAFTSH